MKCNATLLLLSATAAFCFAACKSGDENLNPTPEGLLSGHLLASRQLDIDSPATKYTEAAQAFFVLHPGDTMRISVDSVRVNGFPLAPDNSTKLYKTAGPLQMNTTCNWQVWSGVNVATFAYNFSTPYPAYNYTLPDTIDRGNTLNIPLPTGSDSSTISLSANQRLAGSFNGGSGSFSSAQLGGLDGGAAMLEVSGYKRTTQAFGGKNFLFTKMTTKTKAVWLK